MLDEVAKLREALSEYTDLMRRAHTPSGTTNKQEIHLNAGGIGIWICATLCLVMFVITLGIGWLYLDASRRLDVANDKLSIILQWAPQLRDIVDKSIKKGNVQ